MAKETIRLRFNGPAVDAHTMDVVHLGPALIAVGELCKVANRKFNEDRANMRVLVQTDREHKCFEVSLQVVLQSLLEEVQSHIFRPDIRDAKDLIEWIGLVGGLTAGSTFGLIRFLAWLKGRKPEGTHLVDADGRDVVQISVKGDSNTVNLDPHVWALAKDKQALRRANEVVAPLRQEGYESIEFE